jgi:hypothetical protein
MAAKCSIAQEGSSSRIEKMPKKIRNYWIIYAFSWLAAAKEGAQY